MRTAIDVVRKVAADLSIEFGERVYVIGDDGTFVGTIRMCYNSFWLTEPTEIALQKFSKEFDVQFLTFEHGQQIT